MLLNRGFNPCVEAKIQAVIMGAIADSSTATWITLNAAAKLQHTTRKSVRASLVYIKT
jgi:hypothetical protein